MDVQFIEHRRRALRRQFFRPLCDVLQVVHLLLTQEQMDDLQNIAKRAKELPSQGTATVFDKLNIHTGPNRSSPSFSQIAEGEDVEVVAHSVSTRVVDGETRPVEDWFLVRTET